MPIFSAGSATVAIVPDFRGAQQAIGDWFARQGNLDVKVKPDLNAADMAAIRAQLGSLSGTAEVKVDKTRLQSDLAAAVTGAFTGAIGLFNFGSALNKLIAPSLVAAVGGLAAELASSVATAATGALALVPALAAGALAPLAAVVVGINGVGEAFKALASGNVQKINAEMAKLAPAAQQFVTQIQALGPAWHALHLDVQQQLFAGLGAEVTQLAHVALPVLRTGLADIAGSLNAGLKATIDQLILDGPAFTVMFANINTAIRTVATGAMPVLIQDFVQMAQLGSQFLPQLATGFTTLVGRFDTFLQHSIATGQFVAIIQQAIQILDQLGNIVLNLGKSIFDIFRAAAGPAQVLLAMLVQFTAQLHTVLSSTAGQTALKDFFNGITTALAIILPALSQFIQALVLYGLPIISAFVRALAPVIALVGTELAGALKVVGGLVPPLAQTLGNLIGAFAPLIPVIGQLIATLLPPLNKILAELVPVIGQLTQAFGTALLQAVQAIAPFIQPLGDAFVKILAALTPLLPALGHLATEVLPPLLTALVGLVNILVPVLTPILKLLADHMGLVAIALGAWYAAHLVLQAVVAFQAVGGIAGIVIRLATWLEKMNLISAATKIWAAVQWVLNAAMDANPIGIVILAVVALIAIVVVVITHFQFFKDVFTTVWHWIVDHWQLLLGIFAPIVLAIVLLIQHWGEIWSTVTQALIAAWNTVVAALRAGVDAVVGFFTGVFVPFFTQTIPHFWNVAWTSVRDFFVGIWDAIAGFVQRNIIDWFTGTFLNFFTQTIPNAFKSAWTGIRDFFVNLWNDLVGWFTGVLNTFAGFFTKVWTDLRDGVSTIWHGLIHALEAPVQLVVDWVWNNTLRPAWNLLNNLWGGEDLPRVTIPGFDAAGGAILPGWSPGVDVHHFYSPTAGHLNLSGGEAIMRPEWTAAVGPGYVAAMNAAAVTGGIGGVQSALGFAGGGVWPSENWPVGNVGRGDRSTGWASSMLSFLDPVIGFLSPILPGGSLLKAITDYLTADAKASNDQGSGAWAHDLGSFGRTIGNHLWDAAKQLITGWFNTQQAAGGGSFGGSFSGGAGVQQWAGMVSNALSLMGQDQSLSGVTLYRMNLESGGNPFAINRTDSNWIAGHPSVGLMQVIGPTYQAYRDPRRDVGPYAYGTSEDPLSNTLASMHYALRTYGSLTAAYGRVGGYDGGGWLLPGLTTVYNGTGAPELVLNPAQQNALAARLSSTSGAMVTGGLHVTSYGTSPNDVAEEVLYAMRVTARGGVWT